MMTRALIDTNVLFEVANENAPDHELARELLDEMDRGRLPDGVVTNYVVAEALSLVGGKLRPAIATDLLDRLDAGEHFHVEHATEEDFDVACKLFVDWPGLSFVDATIVAYMNRVEIEYLYSFDDDFDRIDGIARLESVHNPF